MDFIQQNAAVMAGHCQRIINGVVNDPNVNGYIDQTIINIVASQGIDDAIKAVAFEIQTRFNNMIPDEGIINGILTNAILHRFALEVLQRRGVEIPIPMFCDAFNFMESLYSRAKSMQQRNYNYGNSGGGMYTTGAPNYGVAPGRAAGFNTAPAMAPRSTVYGGSAYGQVTPSSGHSSPSAFGVTTAPANPTPRPQEEVNMNQNQHVPAPTRQVYDFTNSNVEITKKPEPAAQPKSFVKKEVVDFTDHSFDNREVSTISSLFNTIKDIIHSPVVVKLNEVKFLPSFAPTDDAAIALNNIRIVESVDEMIQSMLFFTNRHAGSGIQAWLDKRISHSVEMLLRHRYGMGGKSNVYVKNILNIYPRLISALRDKSAAMADDVDKVIIQCLRDLFHSINYEPIEINTDNLTDERFDKDYVGKGQLVTTVTSHMLTLPWVMEYDENTASLSNDAISEEQLNNIYDQVVDIIGNTAVHSFYVIDVSGTRYRVYRKGTAFNSAGTYFVEHTMF